jgi:DNA-binding SARP family transcriptional activator
MAAKQTTVGQLLLLGGFAFSVRGEPVLGVPSGAKRLLAFLAMGDHPVPRPQVAGTLWPDSSDERAGASLRSLLSRLDGPAREGVKVEARDLALADGLVVDLRVARALARRLVDLDAPLSHFDVGAVAVAVLSGDLLPGWYEEWVSKAAAEWRQLRMHALEAVAARLTAADRFAEAAAAALAAVRTEPLRESARAALIRVHMAEGNQSEALGEYESYRVLLRAALGIEPTWRINDLVAGLGRR